MDTEEFMEDDGRDPGLAESAYDGAEYELVGFGERIGEQDTDDSLTDEATEEEMTPSGSNPIEEGFGETLRTEGVMSDQLEDDKLHEEAKADYKDAEDSDIT